MAFKTKMPGAIDVEWSLYKQQIAFVNSQQHEVLYGGARGGGKSHAQVVDAWLYAFKYPKSKQLIMRRTFPELKMSIIELSKNLYPVGSGTYNNTEMMWRFVNGSIITFGYCDSEDDVRRYKSAEFDCVRIDEATDFTEFMYTMLLGSIRGVNDFPKQMKCTTNPGGVGHKFFKERFLDEKQPNTVYTSERGRSQIFIPATVFENLALMESDPLYVANLMQLPPNEQQMYLYGNWNVFEGQFFPEFSLDVHMIEPFEIPKSWRKFISLDYGFDCTCALWWAISNSGAHEYIYREVWEPNLNLSSAADRILEMSEGEKIDYIVASPDLINRSHDTGMSGFEILRGRGLTGIRPADDRRIAGWIEAREHLKHQPTITGVGKTAKVQIFRQCIKLRDSLEHLAFDKKRPNDAADQPHKITHAAEAFRYGCMSRINSVEEEVEVEQTPWERFTKTQIEREQYVDWSI